VRSLFFQSFVLICPVLSRKLEKIRVLNFLSVPKSTKLYALTLSRIQRVKQQFAEPESDLSYRVIRAARKAPPWYARLLISGISLAVFGGLVWSCFWKFPVTTVARGQLAPSDDLRPVRSLDSGTIIEVTVEEGQRVERGEPLIEQDPALSEVEIKTLQSSADLIRNDIARLNREKAGEQIPLSEIRDQLLVARLQEFQSRLRGSQEAVEKQESALEVARIELSNLEVALRNARTKEQSLRQLQRTGATSNLSYIDARDAVTSLEGQVAAQRERIRQAEQDYKIAREEVTQISAERTSAVLTQINEIEKELALVNGQLERAQTQLSMEFVKAPVAGRVYNIKATLGPVQAGEELLSILPEGEELLVEARLSNRDRGFVAEGMEVRIKVDAFPSQDYGSIEGRVLRISPDAVQDELLGQVFPVTIELNEDSTASLLTRVRRRGLEQELTPGLNATAEIITHRERTVMDFLLEPVVQGLDRAFSVQ